MPIILKKNELSNFSRLLNTSARITVWTLHVRANFVFRLFNVFLRFRGQSVKKACLRFAVSNFSEKLQNIFEIVLKNKERSYKNRSDWKNISKEKIRRQIFGVYVLINPLSKFGGNRTNSFWVLAFYSVRFKWKKLILENST